MRLIYVLLLFIIIFVHLNITFLTLFELPPKTLLSSLPLPQSSKNSHKKLTLEQALVQLQSQPPPLTAESFLARLKEDNLFAGDDQRNQQQFKNSEKQKVENSIQKTSSNILSFNPNFIYRAYLTKIDDENAVNGISQTSETLSAQTRLQLETNKISPTLSAKHFKKTKLHKLKTKSSLPLTTVRTVSLTAPPPLLSQPPPSLFTTTQNSKPSRQRQSSPTSFLPSDIPPAAACEPELVTVHLAPLLTLDCNSSNQTTPSLINTSSPSSDLFFPHCIRLPRCGGCCPSPALQCTPTATTAANISVLQLRFSPSVGRFALFAVRRLTVERHLRCGCRCALSAAACRPGQRFAADRCSCICPDQEVDSCRRRQQLQQQQKRFLKAASLSFPLRWNADRCQCECRPPGSTGDQFSSTSVRRWHCSSGHRFDGRTCSCRPLKMLRLDNRNNF